MKKIISLLLALCLLAACSFAGAESPALAGKPWVDSNVYGNWPSERPGLEESFDLFVNFDTYQNAPTESARGVIAPSLNTVDLINGYLESICTDPEKAGTEAECLRILYRLFTDAKQEEVFGTLKAHAGRLRAAKTPEELTELIREEGCLYGDALYDTSLTELHGVYEVPTDVYYVIFNLRDPIDYLPPDEETYESPGLDFDGTREMLVRMGWSEEEAALLVDKMVATVDLNRDYYPKPKLEEDLVRRDGILSLNEIREICPQVYEMIKAQGMAREGEEAEMLYSFTPAHLSILAELFREENLETAKVILALGLYRQADQMLPKETEGAGANMVQAFRQFAPQVVYEQAFVHNFIPQERIDIYRQLVDEYKAAMRVRIGQNSRLSEESKQAALNKIEQLIGSEILYPYGEIDCASLLEALRSAGNLLEANGACQQLKGKERVHYAGKKIDRGNRYATTESALNEEGKYYPMNNAFFIGAGALVGEMADFTSRETILATLGFHLGHELSHGFDTNGSQYDPFGQKYDESTTTGCLITEEDRDAFSARARVIAGQVSRVDIWNGNNLNGEAMIGEVMADLTSVQLAMDIAKQTEGFDYDAYFRAFAKAYYYIDYSSDHIIMRFEGEVHPPHYFRVNFNLAHFDEFYQTYPSVTEGTPMYIAPEDRTLPW